jgi:hypothetical protein
MMPADLSVTELAVLIGLTRRQLEYRLEQGTVPYHQVSRKRGSHRRIAIETVRVMFPEAYDRMSHIAGDNAA